MINWNRIARRLRKIDTPWERERGRFFVDSSEDARTHSQVLPKLLELSQSGQDDIDPFCSELLRRLGVLTSTLERLLECAFEESRVRTVVRTNEIALRVLDDDAGRARHEFCQLLASEHHCRKYWVPTGSAYALFDSYRKVSRGRRIVHTTGTLSELPDVFGDVALLAYVWLVFGGGLSPGKCRYPAVPADVRWTDAYVRYIEPAAKMVAAYRMGLTTHPTYQSALRHLDANDVPYSLAEQETILGDRGFDWQIRSSTLALLDSCGAPQEGTTVNISGDFVDEEKPWSEALAACRAAINEAQVREGLTEDELFTRLKKRFPKEGFWDSLDSAFADGIRPFPLRDDEGIALRECLMADLWNEYFGELAVQWDVMRLYDRMIDPKRDAPNDSAVIKRIEKSLHGAVCNALKRKFGEADWWVEGVLPEIRKTCAALSEEDRCRYAKESYMYLLDLSKIVKDNWIVFGPSFENALNQQGKRAAEDWFNKLNRIRNRLAHPLRGDLDDSECEFVRDSDQKVALLTARIEAAYGSRPQVG